MHEGLFNQTLRCPLTAKEVAGRANELARIQKQIEDNETEAKSVADAYKQKRKGLEVRRRELAREVREESTFRPVECVQRYEDGLIQTVRTDTGEVIAERPATESERQTTIFERGAGPDPADEDGREETDDPAAEDAAEPEEGAGDGH
jgi:hypothetical protein